LEAALILHDVHNHQFAVLPGLSLLNFEVNLRRQDNKLTSCSWYVCAAKTEVSISDFDTCTAQFKLENGFPTRVSHGGKLMAILLSE